MRTINRLALGMTLGLTLAGSAIGASARTLASQSPTATITPSADSTAPHNWTTEQILTCTVSQCWQLGGRNETGFFDIIQQLTLISAQNRNVTLPDDAAAGARVGNYIKMKAKEDRQALLYSVVDAAIRHMGDKAAAAAK